MRKWVMVVLAAVLALVVFAVIFESVTLDLFFDLFVDEPEATVDGEAWRENINSFEDGTDSADRDFLIRKLLAFSAAAEQTHFARLAYKYYYEEFEAMADDGILDGREDQSLRDLYSEVLSEEMVEQWHRDGGTLIIGEK